MQNAEGANSLVVFAKNEATTRNCSVGYDHHEYDDDEAKQQNKKVATIRSSDSRQTLVVDKLSNDHSEDEHQATCYHSFTGCSLLDANSREPIICYGAAHSGLRQPEMASHIENVTEQLGRATKQWTKTGATKATRLVDHNTLTSIQSWSIINHHNNDDDDNIHCNKHSLFHIQHHTNTITTSSSPAAADHLYPAVSKSLHSDTSSDSSILMREVASDDHNQEVKDVCCMIGTKPIVDSINSYDHKDPMASSTYLQRTYVPENESVLDLSTSGKKRKFSQYAASIMDVDVDVDERAAINNVSQYRPSMNLRKMRLLGSILCKEDEQCVEGTTIIEPKVMNLNPREPTNNFKQQQDLSEYVEYCNYMSNWYQHLMSESQIALSSLHHQHDDNDNGNNIGTDQSSGRLKQNSSPHSSSSSVRILNNSISLMPHKQEIQLFNNEQDYQHRRSSTSIISQAATMGTANTNSCSLLLARSASSDSGICSASSSANYHQGNAMNHHQLLPKENGAIHHHYPHGSTVSTMASSTMRMPADHRAAAAAAYMLSRPRFTKLDRYHPSSFIDDNNDKLVFNLNNNDNSGVNQHTVTMTSNNNNQYDDINAPTINTNTNTLELVRTTISKDHQLIPMLRKMAYRCHVCGSGFEDRHRLQQHLSIHLNLHPSWFEETTIKDTMARYESRRGDYLCTVCNIRFDTTSDFDKHMQLHGEKPHHCDLCVNDNKPVSFKYFRQLLTHLRSHCFLYSCRFAPECKQTANRKDYLKLHILKHHLNNKLPEQYTICCH